MAEYLKYSSDRIVTRLLVNNSLKATCFTYGVLIKVIFKRKINLKTLYLMLVVGIVDIIQS